MEPQRVARKSGTVGQAALGGSHDCWGRRLAVMAVDYPNCWVQQVQRWTKGATRATSKNMNTNASAPWSDGSDVNHEETDGFLK